jgi:hypothetical protein
VKRLPVVVLLLQKHRRRLKKNIYIDFKWIFIHFIL